MKYYDVCKGNEHMFYNEREQAIERMKKMEGWQLRKVRRWTYYDVHYWLSKDKIRDLEIEEKDGGLREAVERSIKGLMETIGLYGKSGYTLNRVYLNNNHNGTATLTVEGWPFSGGLVGFKEEMLNKENLEIKSLDFEGVTEDEFPGDIIEIQINK